MIVFVGGDNGFFVEEVAAKYQMETAFIKSDSMIQKQINYILSYSNIQYIVYDLSQYGMDSEELAEWIKKVENATGAKTIILAEGYLPNSKLLTELYRNGVRYFILATSLGEQKEQLEFCFNGFYDANNPLDIEIETLEEQTEKIKSDNNIKFIGLTGSMHRIGTTTHAIQLVKYLKFLGYKACYVEMNENGFVDALKEWYIAEEDEYLGKIQYEDVDIYYNLERLPEIMSMGYDYYIYDYGTYTDRNFNRTSFLEKDIRVFVCGSSPMELPKAYEVIKNSFYTDMYYVFNFIPESEIEDVLELMDEKADRTLVCNDYIADPFVLKNPNLYDDLLKIPKVEIEEEIPVKKKFSLFGKRK